MNAPFRPLERLLRLNEVEQAVGLKKTRIYDLVNEGRFPKPRRLSGIRASRWRASDIAAWIEDQLSG